MEFKYFIMDIINNTIRFLYRVVFFIKSKTPT